MNLILDLDGVVYRGETLIAGSDTALRKAAQSGATLWFVTNNSSRTPDEVAAKLGRLTGASISPDSIFTSAQAAASMIGVEDTPVYVLGMEAIEVALAARGLTTTSEPELARAVVVGMDRSLTYERLAGAVSAIRAGARFIATNIDPTYPVEDGLEPGSGSIVAAVSTAAEKAPEVAGKPNPAMVELMRERGVGPGWVVGDRLDTDIALAGREGSWGSVLVLTGVTSVAADHSKADHVVEDLAAAVDLVLDERNTANEPE